MPVVVPLPSSSHPVISRFLFDFGSQPFIFYIMNQKQKTPPLQAIWNSAKTWNNLNKTHCDLFHDGLSSLELLTLKS